MKNKSSFITLILTCTLLLSGCVVTKLYYKKAEYDIGLIHKIAVLPFEDFTTTQYSGENMKEKVIIELLANGYEVIEEGEVKRRLIDMKVQNATVLTLDDIRALGEDMGVDAVIKGAVSQLQIEKGGSVSYPEVALNLRMIEVINGDTVWSVSNNAGGPSFLTRHFGTEGMTLDEAAHKVVKEAINTLK